MKKPESKESRSLSHVDHEDSEFVERFSDLSAFLMDETWDDGSPRVTGTLFVFASGTVWKVMLKCRDTNRTAFLTANTLLGLWAALDEALSAGRMDWRDDRKPAGRGR
jgi:hypothetical protein